MYLLTYLLFTPDKWTGIPSEEKITNTCKCTFLTVLHISSNYIHVYWHFVKKISNNFCEIHKPGLLGVEYFFSSLMYQLSKFQNKEMSTLDFIKLLVTDSG